MERVINQPRWKENIAQKYRYTQTHRTPVVELLGLQSVEEVHPHHDKTGYVKRVEDQLWPSHTQSEMADGIKHDTYREHSRYSSNSNVENIDFLFKSCFHIIAIMLQR